jgi:hypothetical protein
MKKICNFQIINKNNYSTKQCKNKTKNDSLYCYIHIKHTQDIIYPDITNNSLDINFLDNNYSYTLMGLYDSWAEINKNDIIYMDGEYWNIDILTSHFTNQLNNSNMENPYPSYPSSPFNRKPFTVSSLTILKNKLKELKRPINIALKLLVSIEIDTLQTIYNDVSNNNNNFSQNILDLLESKYRYMLINNKNSQDAYVGLWVKNNIKFSPFEKLYNKLKNMPYQVIINEHIILNPDRIVIEKKMGEYIQNIDMYDKKYCELL